MLPRVYIFFISTLLCLNSICKAQVPVQPSWTEDKSNSIAPTKVHVEITNKNLYETSVIRAEINKAIEEGIYAVGRENEEEIVELADEYLGKEYRISEYLSELMGDSVQQLLHHNEGDLEFATATLVEIAVESQDGNITKTIKTPEITPNIIESILAQEVYGNFNGETFIPQYRPEDYSSRLKTREILEIIHITEDLDFILGQGVHNWKVLNKNSREGYRKVIGLKNDAIILVTEKNRKFELIYEYQVQLDQKSIIETMTVWNNTSGGVHGFVIISNKTEIHWLDDNKLETIWKWHIERPITALKYFKWENNHFLIVVTNGTTDVGNASVTVYQFDLFKKEIWLRQLIPLQVDCSEIAFLNTGRDLVAAFPQNDHVIIFHYNNHEERFKNITKIPSVDVNCVSGFQMGGFSYLAIGGYQPQILRYHRGKFHPQTILNPSFGLVEFFLPVQARTYRDDLILLVQHRLDFTTHDLSVVEALIWDGEAFVASPSVPCHIDHVIFNFGVNCMIDVDRKDGIKGSAVLIDGQNITILVPRYDAPSGLFDLSFELVPRNAELDHLKEIFSFLKIVAEKQNEIIEEAESVLVSENETMNNSTVEWIIDELETHNLIFGGEIDNLFVNEYQWIPADSDINLTDVLDSLEKFGKDLDMLIESTEQNESKNEMSFIADGPSPIVKRETSDKVIKILRIDVLHVDELFVKNINNISIDEILFISNNEIHHNGTIIFDADATIHKLSLIDQTVSNRQKRTLEDSLTSLTRDSLHINGNLEFDSINGIPWVEFISEVVLMDKPNQFGEMEVLGNVILENNLTIDTLNEQKFPDGYLLSNGPQESIILGEKRFHQTIKTNAVDCEGLINGVNPFDFITLSDPQIITGETTFNYVEVTSSLEINGTISGKYMDEFLANPNILKTNVIQAACMFQHLEVNGPITVEENFNGLTLDEVLNDVIYKTDEEMIIPSFKKFNKIIFEKELDLTSNLISGIELYDFVTKNTEQDLNINILEGNVFFNNLYIEGLYDLINVTELDENSIKTFGEQYTEAQLEFVDENEIITDNLEISFHLNDIPVEQYYRISDEIALEEASFENVEIDSLTIECNVEGNGTLNGVDLYEFDMKRLSHSRNQTLPEGLSIGNAICENNLIVNNINGFQSDYILPILEKFINISQVILSESMFLQKLIVTGDVNVNEINGNNFNEIQENAIWLNKPNYINTDIQFLDDVIIEADLQIQGYLNNQNFVDFLEDLILNSDPIFINSAKKFIKPLQIVNNAEINYINGKPFSDIATKRSISYFRGSLEINGDLYVNDLTVRGQFNNYNMNGFKNIYKYDEEHDVHIIGAEVLFDGNITVNKLHSEGSFGSISNLDEFLENLVLKNAAANISGHKIFLNDVNFTENLNIDWLNDIEMNDILEGVVLINDPDPITIHTSITFKDAVSANYIEVNDELATYNLMGCSIYEWLVNGLRTDIDINVAGELRFHEGALDGNSLNAVYVNNKLISDAITIHTSQNISQVIQFSDVILGESLAVDGYINRVDLKKERENTLMVYGDQHITAPTTMQSLRVLKNLETLTEICGKDIRHAATLNGDIQIRSPITFTAVTAGSVYSNDLISGIDFNEWYINSLWSFRQNFQVVTGNWTANAIIVKGFSDGNGLINGVPVSSLEQQFQELDLNTSSEFENEYDIQCHRAKYLLSGTRQRAYFLKYFEDSFNVIADGEVISSTVFRNGNDHYLIANYKCFSAVYLWKIIEGRFEGIYTFEAGYVTQIIIVSNDNGDIHLITNSKETSFNCKLVGINIWEFYPNQTNHYKNIGENHDHYSTIYSDPNLLGKFFAINIKTNSLIEFEINSFNQRKWDLPSEMGQNYEFIPHDAELGRILSDGSHMVLIESIDHVPLSKKIRKKRFSSTNFRERLKNFTESMKLKRPVSKLAGKYDDRMLKSETVFNKNLREVGNRRLLKPSSDDIKIELQHTIDDVIVGLVNDLELLKCPQRIFDEELGVGWDLDKPNSDDESSDPLSVYHTTTGSFISKTELNTENLIADTKTTEKITQNDNNNSSGATYNGLKDVVKEVAKKLWVGLIEVESIRNVINHAKGIYEEFVTQNLDNNTSVDLKVQDRKDPIVGESLTAAINRFTDIMETTINDIGDIEKYFDNSTEVGTPLLMEDKNKDKYQIFEEKIQNVIEELLQMVKNINENEAIVTTTSSFYSDIEPSVYVEKTSVYDILTDENESTSETIDSKFGTNVAVVAEIQIENGDVNNNPLKYEIDLESNNTVIDLAIQATTIPLETFENLGSDLLVSEVSPLMSMSKFEDIRNESLIPEVLNIPDNKVEDDLVTVSLPSQEYSQSSAQIIQNEFTINTILSEHIKQMLNIPEVQHQEVSITPKMIPDSSKVGTHVLYENTIMGNTHDIDSTSERGILDTTPKTTEISPHTANKSQVRTETTLTNLGIESTAVQNEEDILHNNLQENSEYIQTTEPIIKFTINSEEYSPIIENSTASNNPLLTWTTNEVHHQEVSTTPKPILDSSNLETHVLYEKTIMENIHDIDSSSESSILDTTPKTTEISPHTAKKSQVRTETTLTNLGIESTAVQNEEYILQNNLQENIEYIRTTEPIIKFTINPEEFSPIIENSTASNNPFLTWTTNEVHHQEVSTTPKSILDSSNLETHVLHEKTVMENTHDIDSSSESRILDTTPKTTEISPHTSNKSLFSEKTLKKFEIEYTPVQNEEYMLQNTLQENSGYIRTTESDIKFTINPEEYLPIFENSTASDNSGFTLTTNAKNGSSVELIEKEIITNPLILMEVKSVETATSNNDFLGYDTTTMMESNGSKNQYRNISIISTTETNTINVVNQMLLEQNSLNNVPDSDNTVRYKSSTEHSRELNSSTSKSVILDPSLDSIISNTSSKIELSLPTEVTLQMPNIESATVQSEKQIWQKLNADDNIGNSDMYITKSLEIYSETTMETNLLYDENLSHPDGITKFDQLTKDIEQQFKLTEVVSNIYPPTTETYPVYTELYIAQEIKPTGLLTTENSYLPGRHTGELVALRVGPNENRKTLIAVSEVRDHGIVAGQQESVKIYFDVMEGHLFQTISSYKPRSLTSLHIRDETILAFVEDDSIVKIFKYKGIEGFVELITFNMETFITSLYSTTLPSHNNASFRSYLVMVIKDKIKFFEAVMAGEHEVLEDFNCG